MSAREVYLVYDHECPVCDAYCERVQIRESAGTLRRVDARGPGPLMDEITERGLDIDQGMVLKVGDSLYYGSDAIHELSVMSNQSGMFNGLNYWTFRSERLAHLLYPMLRFLRNLLLKFLHKSKINNLKRVGSAWF